MKSGGVEASMQFSPTSTRPSSSCRRLSSRVIRRLASQPLRRRWRMADYQSPTIVRPDIPRSAMTLLEHRLLIGMFSHEGAEDAVYFFAEEYVNDLLHLDLPEVHRLLGHDPFPASYAVQLGNVPSRESRCKYV